MKKEKIKYLKNNNEILDEKWFLNSSSSSSSINNNNNNNNNNNDNNKYSIHNINYIRITPVYRKILYQLKLLQNSSL